MKVLRANSQTLLDGAIEDVRVVGHSNTVVMTVRTFGKGTIYKVVMTGQDIAEFKHLLNGNGLGELS